MAKHPALSPARGINVTENEEDHALDTAARTPELFQLPSAPGKRRVRNGKPTNDLVLSVFSDGNDRAFPSILALYVKPGSIVADVTYGRGVFWRRIPQACTSYGLPTFRTGYRERGVA